MTTENQSAMLEKIRALLAKAEGTKFPEEAKAFTAKAQELMTKYAIDEAMLEAGKEDYGSIDQTEIWIDANEYRAPKIELLSSVALANDCKILWWKQVYREVEGKQKRQFRVGIIGFQRDRDWVVQLYTSLLLQSEHELLSPDIYNRMKAECPQGGHSIRWRNSFMIAYAGTIYWKLQEAKKVARTEAKAHYSENTMAMVFVGRKSLVERKFSELHPNCKTSKGHDAGGGMGSAGRLGAEAAARADLGRGKVSGGQH